MGSEADNFQLDLAAAEAINNQEANSKPILTYGSLIYLTFSEENLTEYYAYSEGLTKTKVLLKTKESFHREGSYMRGLFRIYPSFYQNEYAKGKELFEEIISAGASQLNKRGKDLFFLFNIISKTIILLSGEFLKVFKPFSLTLTFSCNVQYDHFLMYFLV